MRKALALVLCIVLNASTLGAVLGGASPAALDAAGGERTSAAGAFSQNGAAASGGAVGPTTPVAAPRDPYTPPYSGYREGITVGGAGDVPPDEPQAWWYAREFNPEPQSVIVGSETSIILFVLDSSGGVQVPTDADIAAGAKPVGLANNTTRAFTFTAKLFETTVGNGSIAENDLDLGVPNQTVTAQYDGIDLNPSPAPPIVTGNSTSAIPQPFRFVNGTFSFVVPRLPDVGCGGHTLRIDYDNQSFGNNATYFASTRKDFRIYQTCETTLTVSADLNPVVVGDTITFYGGLTGSRTEAVPGRPIQILMDGKLLGLTGPGAFFDKVQVEGTNFNDDFEDLNASQWNQSGAGVGTWTVGALDRPDCRLPPNDPLYNFTSCPTPVEPGSVNMAGTGLTGNYGKGLETWLVSPAIDLTAPTAAPQLRFFFWYHMAYDDTFEVAVSPDGGATWYNVTSLTTPAPSGLVMSSPQQGHPTWEPKGIDLGYWNGTPALLIGFHFRSVDHTAVTSNPGTYQFRFQMPPETTAGSHVITAQFYHGIPFDPTDGITIVTDPSWDLAYQAAFFSIPDKIRLTVKRTAHFVFNATDDEKIGFRGKSLTIGARLLDNQNEPLVPDPLTAQDRILVDLTWDRDYDDTFDSPTNLTPGKAAVTDEGTFTINYVVETVQPLGLHNVTFMFPGAAFYVPASDVDIYRLMGTTYAIWPAEADRWVYRGLDKDVKGEIRVVPSESRNNRQVGDPVQSELVHITWGGDEIPAGQVGVVTNNTGGFLAAKSVPFDDPLGKKSVVLTYTGSDIYTPLTSGTNWSVISEVTILFENTSVYKGSLLWINGTMLDDRGVGIDKQTLQVFFDFELVSPITTESDGSFSLAHAIPTEMTVGAKQVLIRFLGNAIYRLNETVSFVAVKAHTQIERTDHTQAVDRGRQLNVTAQIFEVYEGGVRGAPVAQEGVSIRIQDQRLTVQVSNSEGKLQFRSAVPAALPWGEAILAFEYNGSEFYDPALNETPIVIRGQAVVAFLPGTCTLNGAPFNVSSDVVHQRDELACLARVTDELGNPLAAGDFRLFYTRESTAGILGERIFISAGPIDELGRYEFNVTWDDFVEGNRSLIGVFNGTFCPTFINARTLCLRPGEGNFTVQYKYLNPPPVPPDPTIYYIVGVSVAVILGSAFYFFWYAAKRRQLQKMQRIIRRAADRLVSGNTYAQAIFEAYRTLSRFLQSHGYLRQDSETFREFEAALRQALPIDAKSMDEFLSVLEEARYSDHEIGEQQRDRAIATLRAVNASIEQVLLSGGAALAGAPPQAPPAPQAPPPQPPSEPGAPPAAPPPA
ncbi:MAG TPA: DUF4129 domain-containing protein [Candidatus Thermoplasmatota archaeon]|nr:DUF4129 domain-containing protein [Candidatus Thermoplasmatota archaeon]